VRAAKLLGTPLRERVYKNPFGDLETRRPT
jgi:hypothetical protein